MNSIMKKALLKGLKWFTVSFVAIITIFVLIFLLTSFLRFEWVEWDWYGVRFIFNIAFVIGLIPAILKIIKIYDNDNS